MKESTQTRLSRRTLVRAASAATAMLASPKLLRIAAAATPIKIGIPTVITGGYAVLGSHVMRTCKLVEKMMGAKSGWCETFDIAPGCFREVEERLFQSNIHEQSLFPDMEGLAGLVRQKTRLHWT